MWAGEAAIEDIEDAVDVLEASSAPLLPIITTIQLLWHRRSNKGRKGHDYTYIRCTFYLFKDAEAVGLAPWLAGLRVLRPLCALLCSLARSLGTAFFVPFTFYIDKGQIHQPRKKEQRERLRKSALRKM